MWPTGRYLNEPVLDHAFAHSQANRGTRHSIVCPQLDALRRFLCKLAGQVTEKQKKKRVIQAKCIWMYSTSSGSQEHVYWKNSENLQKKQKTHAGFKYSWGPKLTVVSFLCAFFSALVSVLSPGRLQFILWLVFRVAAEAARRPLLTRVPSTQHQLQCSLTAMGGSHHRPLWSDSSQWGSVYE